MRVLGLFQMIDWAALDQFFKLRPPEPQDSRIVIVTIDEDTIRKVGTWPIPDAVLAKMLDKIRQQKPVAIGLDLYRDLPVQPGNEKLIQILKSTPNLIGVKKVVGDGYGPEVNPHPILSKRDQIAASDLLLDADGKVRRGLISLESKSGEEVVSLGTQLSLMYLEKKGIELKELDAEKRHYQLGKATFIPFEKNDGGYIRADDRGYQILLNFRGTQDNFQKYSIMQVVNGQVPPNWGRDRIVLVGATAASLHDDFFTPYSTSVSAFPERMPGVVIHANVISQILSAALDGRPMMRGSSQEIQWLWIILWSFVGAILGWTLRSQKFIYKNISYRETILSLIVAGSSLIFGSYLVFLQGWWIPVVPAMLGLGGSAIAIAIYTTRLERQDRYTLMALFKQQVTSQVADQIWTSRHNLLQKGSIVGREMTATVLFSDLEGFTSIATTITPTALMSWLNEYMQAMADIVLEYNGMVNKFIGDAVMALFGVPIERTRLAEIAVDAENAVGCALAMADKLRSLNQQWQLSGNPTVAIRIGIATGTVVTGMLGNAQRAEYTALGDTVNVAARLESYDKSLNCGLCRILISEETYQHIKDKFPTKFIGSSQLKGRDELTPIYQVLLS
ncbi:adenylate/guanylate cyclase domain-containing protein [Anabaena catenula FACHB-362]|uniref:Adenylate/guanylate cyclase domain-containing protein n=2 Tax=Anabaena TaxID=1163 RepID=A0ABR8JA62_9NOST|nr:adenylate/guanylate cyclase domain-containing protein [Anabaena catenula]MBD2694528.1 adenylate/guanylate cyclase domain-containing protein [Anabaena catenula FACHB-362]